MIFVGVTVSGALYTSASDARARERIERVQREQDRDMCDMLYALIPSEPPPGREGPWPPPGIARYRASRC